MSDTPRKGWSTLGMLRLVHTFIVVALLVKIILVPVMYHNRMNHRIVDSFFPFLLQHPLVELLAWSVAVAASAGVLVLSSRGLIRGACVLSFASLSLLCLHLNAYNDMTFHTAAWTSLFCLWLSTRLDEPAHSLHPRASWLAHLILSLVFLGASVGKLTSGYWSGQVFYEIYFVDRDFWIYNGLRANLDPETLRSVATHHSRLVIISELFCGFLWLLPRKAASLVALVMLYTIPLTNNALLFSVVGSLIGLALLGWIEPESPPTDDSVKAAHG